MASEISGTTATEIKLNSLARYQRNTWPNITEMGGTMGSDLSTNILLLILRAIKKVGIPDLFILFQFGNSKPELKAVFLSSKLFRFQFLNCKF